MTTIIDGITGQIFDAPPPVTVDAPCHVSPLSPLPNTRRPHWDQKCIVCKRITHWEYEIVIPSGINPAWRKLPIAFTYESCCDRAECLERLQAVAAASWAQFRESQNEWGFLAGMSF